MKLSAASFRMLRHSLGSDLSRSFSSPFSFSTVVIATRTISSSSGSSGSAGSPPQQHSLLRFLIPLKIKGTSRPPSVLLRHAFLHREEPLLTGLFTTLASAPASFPSTPRILLAEAFQMVLEGTHPQRKLREAFELAELACRRALLDFDELDPSFFVFTPPPPPPQSTSSQENTPEARAAYIRSYYAQQEAAERAAWRTIRYRPLHRLWMFELRAAASYYTRLFSIPTTGHSSPDDSASLAVHTIVAADVRRDELLTEMMLKWEERAISRGYTELAEKHSLRLASESWWWSPKRWRRSSSMSNQCINRSFLFEWWVRLRCNTESEFQEEWRAAPGRAQKGDPSEVMSTVPPLPWSDTEGGSFSLLTDSHEPLCYHYGRDVYPTEGESVDAASPPASASTSFRDLVSMSEYHYEGEADLTVREILLLERDVFGCFRFDPRGDNRHLFHLHQLEQITKTWDSCALLFHPLVRFFGAFTVRYIPIANHRWMKLEISCNEEDHRVCVGGGTTKDSVDSRCDWDSKGLPLFEEISTVDEEEASLAENISNAKLPRISFMVAYNTPICPIRVSATRKELKERIQFKETFELAIETPGSNNTY